MLSKVENQSKINVEEGPSLLALSSILVPLGVTMIIFGANGDGTFLCVYGACVMAAPIVGFVILKTGAAIKEELAKKPIKISLPRVDAESVEKLFTL